MTPRESISIENERAYFPLLDTLTDPDTPPSVHTLTPEAIHGLAVETASRLGLLPKAGSLAFADINLALHVATPKIEAFYQYYADRYGDSALGEGCESWVDWYGQVVCDPETLEKVADVDTIDQATSHTCVSRLCAVPQMSYCCFSCSEHSLDLTFCRSITCIPQARLSSARRAQQFSTPRLTPRTLEVSIRTFTGLQPQSHLG